MMDDEHRHTGIRSSTFGGALVVLMITSALMQYSLGVLGPVLVVEYGLTRTQLGSLTSVLFLVASTASPLVGQVIDRFGARRALPLPFAATILGFLLASAASSYISLILAIAVAGSGMAFANPLSNKLVALHAPRGRQGLLMGIKQSGVQVAAVTAGILMPTVVARLGLSTANLATAGVLSIGLLAVLRVVPQDVPTARGGPSPSAIRDQVSQPPPRRTTLSWISAYALLMGSGIAAIYAYLPLYATEELGMSVARAGFLAGSIGMIGVVSRVVWGALSERLRHPATALTSLAATAMFAQALVWGSAALGNWAAWTAALVLGASAVAWNAVAMFAVVRVLGTKGAGVNSGFVQLAFFSGFAIGPLLFGLLADASGGYSVGWAAIFSSFALATVVSGRWAWATRTLPTVHVVGRHRSSR